MTAILDIVQRLSQQDIADWQSRIEVAGVVLVVFWLIAAVVLFIVKETR